MTRIQYQNSKFNIVRQNLFLRAFKGILLDFLFFLLHVQVFVQCPISKPNMISPGKHINHAPFQVVLDWVFESCWLFAVGRVATRRRGQRKLWVNVRRLRLQVDRRNLSLRVQGRSLPNLSVLVPTMSPDNQMKIHAVWPLSMSYMKCNKDLKIHSK